MAEVIVQSDRVLIYIEDEDAAKDLSRALDQLGILHQLVCLDGHYNVVRVLGNGTSNGSS